MTLHSGRATHGRPGGAPRQIFPVSGSAANPDRTPVGDRPHRGQPDRGPPPRGPDRHSPQGNPDSSSSTSGSASWSTGSALPAKRLKILARPIWHLPAGAHVPDAVISSRRAGDNRREPAPLRRCVEAVDSGHGPHHQGSPTPKLVGGCAVHPSRIPHRRVASCALTPDTYF